MLKSIKILYGTETGNAQYCAETLGDELEKLNLEYVVEDMGNYEHSQISQEDLVIIVTSTHGNGDAPANAEGFLNYLKDNEIDLSKLKYAVCGLGDTSFTYFAQCGKDFDEVLKSRHAQRVIERVDCDADYDDDYDIFLDRILEYLGSSS
ncbi:MAG: hypothetical protein CMH49_09190 [Myxococcales bacterium]|nr:hypothetical protein [Myxococcales bacterium]